MRTTCNVLSAILHTLSDHRVMPKRYFMQTLRTHGCVNSLHAPKIYEFRLYVQGYVLTNVHLSLQPCISAVHIQSRTIATPVEVTDFTQ